MEYEERKPGEREREKIVPWNLYRVWICDIPYTILVLSFFSDCLSWSY